MWFLVVSLLATAYAMPPSSYYTTTPQPVRVVPSFVPAPAPEIPPIDANDVIYNKDFWVNPSARHIVYNFEHIRRDQPAHVENREEDVGAYFYRRPSTTLRPKINLRPTQVPLLSSRSGVEELARPVEQAPEWSQVVADEQPALPQHPARFPAWTPEQAVPKQVYVPTTQAPSTPRWEEYYRHQTSEPPHLTVTTAPFVASFSGAEITSAGENRAPLDAAAWTRGNAQRPQHRHHDEHTLAPSNAAYLGGVSESQDLAPLDAVAWTRRAVPVAQPQKPRSNGSRGQHKFNWDDLTAHSTDAPVSAAPTQGRILPGGTPPPLPSLTPWVGDSFGK